MARDDYYGDRRERYAAEREFARHDRDTDFGPGGYRRGVRPDLVGVPWVTGMPAAYGAPGIIGPASPGWDDRDRGRDYGPYAWAGSGAGSGRDRRHEHDDGRGFLEKAADEVSSWFGDEDAGHRREMDHRGRGPKGWTRSDERILEDVCHRLTEDDLVDASDVEVRVSGREVTLTGTVSDRAQRRRAEDCAEAVSGVTHVQNDIRVRDPGQQAGSRTIL